MQLVAQLPHSENSKNSESCMAVEYVVESSFLSGHGTNRSQRLGAQHASEGHCKARK